MFGFRDPLLAVLLTTSAVVTVVLGWFGWKNLEQEETVAKQELQERLENGADAFAAGIRGKLTEAGERLSRWVSCAAAPPPSEDGAVIFMSGEGRAEVVPQGALPFVPLVRDFAASDKVFAEAEAIENISRDLVRAADAYRKLSGHGDPRIRAEALAKLRLVFSSERSGTKALWHVQMKDGKPDGESRMIRSPFEDGRPIGISAEGRLYFVVESTLTNSYILPVDLAAGTAGKPARTNQPLRGHERIRDLVPGRQEARVVRPQGGAKRSRSLVGDQRPRHRPRENARNAGRCIDGYGP